MFKKRQMNFLLGLMSAAACMTSSAGESIQQGGEAEGAGTKLVKNVEVKEVKTAPGNKVKVFTVLTYEDGTKAKCNYNWLAIVAPTKDGAALSSDGYRCTPLK